MITYKHNYLFLFLLLFTAAGFGQTKKLEKTYNTSKDVKINIDAKHTNIIVETWDRNEVQIVGTLETGKMSDAEAKALLDNWKLQTSGNSGEVTITSGGEMLKNPDMDMAALSESMGHLQSLIAPIMNEMVAPMLENISKNPPLPPDFADKLGSLNFDYEAYKKDGDKYMQKWEKQVEKNFGKDFEKSMEEWAKQFEKNAEVWGKNLEKEMEVNGKDIEKSMEQWAEKFGAEMEEWGQNFASQMEGKEGAGPMIFTGKGAKANRNIKIKVPANARLNLDVRHGAVNLPAKTTNLKANLSHSKLTGNVIDGEGTDVKVSYTPVNVAQWNYGILNASYVQDLVIDKARSIRLISNSSDVNIKEIEETGILTGTFGELTVGKLSPGFKTLDITLKNSDLVLSLPEVPLNFNYNGTKSDIVYPQVQTVKGTTNYDNQKINGYYKTGNSNRNVSINANFSDVIIK